MIQEDLAAERIVGCALAARTEEFSRWSTGKGREALATARYLTHGVLLEGQARI